MAGLDTQGPVEVQFTVQGRTLAGKRWGNVGDPPVMALHGGLDNANSFDLIVPTLPGYDLFALDFAGHGHSDHRAADTPYLAALDVQDVIATANHLGWERFSLLAHSMGAEVSVHLMGLYPDRIVSLFAIDGYAETVSQEKWLANHRSSIDENLTKQAKPLRVFASQEDMAIKVARTTGQSVASARILVERGSRMVDAGFCWVSDPRVYWSDALAIPREQMDQFLGSFEGKVMVVGANNGFKWYWSDMDRLSAKFKHFRFVAIDGPHHLHMSDAAPELTKMILAFFTDRS
ncbi:MAG: alpha/beta fold hydrolase [Pseudomonadales bacterium]|nr:alpha/beta fold hydrolase [Pseudomonadales bacterium]